jgi:hypothetical protein
VAPSGALGTGRYLRINIICTATIRVDLLKYYFFNLFLFSSIKKNNNRVYSLRLLNIIHNFKDNLFFMREKMQRSEPQNPDLHEIKDSDAQPWPQ